MKAFMVFAIAVGIYIYHINTQHLHKRVAPVQSEELLEFIVDCELQGLKVTEIDALTVSCTPYK
jgi:hypothetical protein